MEHQSPRIESKDLGLAEKEFLNQHLSVMMGRICQTIPQLAPHFKSGGTIEIKTISGAHVRFGFNPERGGLIIPGGISPVTKL